MVTRQVEMDYSTIHTILYLRVLILYVTCRIAVSAMCVVNQQIINRDL